MVNLSILAFFFDSMTQQKKTQQGGFKKGKINSTKMFIDVAF